MSYSQRSAGKPVILSRHSVHSTQPQHSYFASRLFQDLFWKKSRLFKCSKKSKTSKNQRHTSGTKAPICSQPRLSVQCEDSLTLLPAQINNLRKRPQGLHYSRTCMWSLFVLSLTPSWKVFQLGLFATRKK